MNSNKNKHSGLIALVLLAAVPAFAQRGEIENQTYEIVKEKNIEFPVANRLFDKVQPMEAKTTDKKVTYEFIDPKINLASPKLTPLVSIPSDEKSRQNMPEALNNYIKLGGGNYGRFLGEGFVSTRPSDDLVFSANLKQLSAATGPVYGKNSGNSTTDLRFAGKYIRNAYKIDGQVDYDRKNYYFYGYKPQPESVMIDRDSIRQTTNLFGVQLGFENTEAKSLFDYSVRTNFYNLKDRYNASETDWGTTIKASTPVMENLVALFEAGAFISQRVDSETYNRNVFRIKPHFKYNSDFFSITAGVNVVNQTDNTLNINNTRIYPVLNLDVVPIPGLHIYGGWDGDLVRNTLRSMLSENQWLAPDALILNTDKRSDIYAGVKGENTQGINFEGKVSYANYGNFYAYNNSLADTSKFSILYDGDKTNILTVSAQVGYTHNDILRTSLKTSFYNYKLGVLKESWHRPNFSLNWFNALSLNKKLFVSSDFYVIAGLKGNNFQSEKIIKLPTIIDLNLKMDYLLTRNFSTFVSINNILGKQYSRYLYYPQMGLNFVGGLSFSF